MTLRTAGDGVEEKLQHYLHLSGLFGSQELKPSLCFFKSCGAVISEHIQISNRNSSISQTHTHTHTYLAISFLPCSAQFAPPPGSLRIDQILQQSEKLLNKSGGIYSSDEKGTTFFKMFLGTETTADVQESTSVK